MLAFYMDHHIHSAITASLRKRGIDALTLEEDGTAELDDELVLTRANELRRIVVTQDKDFHRIAQHWQTTGREFRGIVYYHDMQMGIGNIIDYLELVANVMSEEAMLNYVERIPSSKRRKR
jgi:hypothetical protein